MAAPQDTDGETVFTDNDGLAARLAHELKAELVVLMTDVDGVFTGPPTDPASKKIDVWCPDIHEEMIRLGEKSAHGRGGMGSKIKAAWCALSRYELLPPSLQLLSRVICLRHFLVCLRIAAQRDAPPCSAARHFRVSSSRTLLHTVF